MLATHFPIAWIATRKLAAVAIAATLLTSTTSKCIAGGGGGSAVGGVYINPEGVLQVVSQAEAKRLVATRQEALKLAAPDLSRPAELRTVSLKQLQQAIRAHLQSNAKRSAVDPLPAEVGFLAGLTRIQYVIVVPENNDILLAGPAEGWKLDEHGEAVGVKSGRSILKLDDFLTALRSTESARGGIECSIDPTAEGIRKFSAFMAQQRRQRKGLDESALPGMEKAMGRQTIRVGGIASNSRFAQVLVAADFRMKQYAMGLVDAPIKGLPSYLSMLKRPGSAMPRWWIAADYKPLLTDADGLTWELRPGVKVLTEDSASSGGKLQPAGRNNAVAQKWADAMTKSFDDLATQESIFAELRNCMDMAVLAALIKTNRLDEKSGLDLSLLLDRERLVTDTYSVPREVDTRVSFVKRGGQWIISASGGVQYAPYEIVSQTQKSETLAKIREKTAATGDAWWQNK